MHNQANGISLEGDNVQNQIIQPEQEPSDELVLEDFGLIGGVVTILAMIFREIRWHRLYGSVKKERDVAKKERDELHRSLKPPQMPPWDDKDKDTPKMPPWDDNDKDTPRKR